MAFSESGVRMPLSEKAIAANELAVVSAKRICELHTLLVHAECCRFLPGDAGVMLRQNPAFYPKVWSESYTCQSLELHPLS